MRIEDEAETTQLFYRGGALVAHFKDGTETVLAREGPPAPWYIRATFPFVRAWRRWWPVVAWLGWLILFATFASAEPVGPLSTYLLETPCRFLDTRDDKQYVYEYPIARPLDWGYHFYRIQGECGVPYGISGALVNVTVTEATAPGHMQFFSVFGNEGSLTPTTSLVNFVPGRTASNSTHVITPVLLESQGHLADIGVYLYAPGGTAHVIIDVIGYLR